MQIEYKLSYDNDYDKCTVDLTFRGHFLFDKGLLL